MAVTLKSLIQFAPFSKDQKKMFLESMDTMSEEQKFRIANIAWSALSLMYQGRLQSGKQLILHKSVYENKTISPKDYHELEKQILQEFARRLEAAESEETVEEVRQQLEKSDKQNLPRIDPSTSRPQQ